MAILLLSYLVTSSLAGFFLSAFYSDFELFQTSLTAFATVVTAILSNFHPLLLLFALFPIVFGWNFVFSRRYQPFWLTMWSLAWLAECWILVLLDYVSGAVG